MSDIHRFCRKVYADFIEAEPIPVELKRSLRAHERVPTFIDRLASEIRKFPSSVSKDEIERLTKDLTRYFVLCVDRAAHERTMSPLARIMERQRAESINEFRKQAEQLETEGTTHVTISGTQGEIIRETTVIGPEFLESEAGRLMSEYCP